MYPQLAQLGPIPIHSYGFLIAIGFLIALYVLKRLSIYSKVDPDRIQDLAFWSLLVGFGGARLLFVITRFEEFAREPLMIFRVWEGGLVFWGGPLIVIPFAVWYLRKYPMPLWKTLDILTPGLVIAHAVGRLGCLAAGCCYGKPTGTEFGIRLYSDLVDRNLHGILLHPTQLYSSVSLLILFVGLLFLFKRKAFDGQIALTYLMVYSVIRSIIEVFRGDLIRGFVVEGWLSTSQFISLLVFAAAAVTLYYRLSQLKKKGSA